MLEKQKGIDDDIFLLLDNYLTDEYQHLLYLDGEIIDEIDYDISQELENEVRLFIEADKYNL